MKIKISELSGIALDWAVAQCEGTASYGPEDFREQRKYTIKHGEYVFRWSSSWAQAGEIIEREKIALDYSEGNNWCAAVYDINARPMSSKAPLVAAMRAYVQHRLGNEVDIPQELLA